MKKVVIFDCDGVMADSFEANTRYWNSIRSLLKRPPLTREERNFVHTHSSLQNLERLFPGDEKAFKAWKENPSTKFIRYMRVEPGLIETLESLKGKSLAVCTSRTESIHIFLEKSGLGKYFDFVVSALDVKKHKPDPEGLLKIVEHFKIRPGEAVYVGDSETDFLAARNAGIDYIQYKGEIKSKYRISSFQELEPLVSRMG